MSYTPKHAATKQASTNGRRAAGVFVLSAATVGTGAVAGTTSAQATATASVRAATPYNVWDRVAQCESGGNWSINTGNGYYGGLQFAYRSWTGFGGTRYAAYAHQATRDQQIIVAQAILRTQGPGAWPTCSRRAGLTRTNGLAVRVGGGTTTVSTPTTSRTTSRKLVVDGALGPMTTRAIQKWVGTTQDGVFGPMTKRALQRKVGAYPDGQIGPATVRSLQRTIGAHQNGARYLDAGTVRALQTYLNARVL
ncbi:transglycosylase family protein [Yimella sp. cx-51]|uniref:transglycosylase family protein n=1 Tax=Yimella sp. cx-51 TaxID=2770551 RepID=UPI00165D57EF|nr:transglycosylase family protein [Yimella sp. cx-51]MBC9955807.1 transglycosylase family protein [Yimella sp. cx-51]QTH37640.1 transglycosylase family protein [Yimella sp. cx-51]